MEYSKVNGYTISKLSLGTVALGLDYGISNAEGRPSREKSFSILSTALSMGINTIDTARNYGDAELLVGSFLDQNKNHSGTNLVTKFEIDSETLLNKDKAREHAYNSIRSSCSNLKISQVPVCLFHKGKDQPVDLVLEVLPSILQDLKDDGLIDLAGISVYYPDEVELFLDLPIVAGMQVPLNIFDQRLISNGMLQRMHLEKKFVFVRSVFLQGLFFMQPSALKGSLSDARQYIEALHDLAIQAGMSIAELAFSYVKDLKGVTSIVFGATTEQQVIENINLLNSKSIPLNVKQAIEDLFKIMPEHIITPGVWKL